MKQPSNPFFILLMILSMAIWGGTWTSSKILANMAAPEVLIFWRFLISAITFIPVMFLFRQSFTLKKGSLKLLLLGSLFLLGYNKFFFWGLQNGLAGAGGVLVTTLNPILTFCFSLMIFRRSPFNKQIIGLILGLIGGSIILQVWAVNLTTLFASGNAFFLLAATSWAFLTVTSEKSKTELSPFVFSFYVYCLATVFGFFLALPYGIWEVFDFGLSFLVNIVYMSLFATTFATTIFFAASRRLGAEKASSFIFTVPFSAVLISWAILGENPTLSTLIGGIIAVSAVYLINYSPTPNPHAVSSSKE